MQEGILTFITATTRRVINACMPACTGSHSQYDEQHQPDTKSKKREKAKILSKTFQEQRLMGKRMGHLFRSRFKVTFHVSKDTFLNIDDKKYLLSKLMF